MVFPPHSSRATDLRLHLMKSFRRCPSSAAPHAGTFGFSGLAAKAPPRGAPWTAGLTVDQAIEKLAREGNLSDVKVSFNSFDPAVNVRSPARPAATGLLPLLG